MPRNKKKPICPKCGNEYNFRNKTLYNLCLKCARSNFEGKERYKNKI